MTVQGRSLLAKRIVEGGWHLASAARATPTRGVGVIRRGATRRLRALCRLLLAVGDRGAHSIAEDVAGTRYGRREMSDPADFAVTCCASLWISFRNEPIGGRYPKAGTFSRFVEELLHEALGIFPGIGTAERPAPVPRRDSD